MTFVGRYAHADLPGVMANLDWIIVPSIWWENSPLVIQEAFHHGRPVICSDIGGWRRKSHDGVNGLHFRAGDPVSLAETIWEAVSTPGLWDTYEGIPETYRFEDHVDDVERGLPKSPGRTPTLERSIVAKSPSRDNLSGLRTQVGLAHDDRRCSGARLMRLAAASGGYPTTSCSLPSRENSWPAEVPRRKHY